jgi:hypothetical protein
LTSTTLVNRDTTTNELQPTYWTDDYEEIQDVWLDTLDPDSGEMANSIYDISFTGLGGGMYRKWVGLAGEVNDQPARLENWHPEDLEAFVGGSYTKKEN